MNIAWEARRLSEVLAGPTRRRALAVSSALALAVVPMPASAHVKWFADYDVEASPAALATTLTNGWLWLGVALVLVSFAIAVLVERHFVRAVVGDEVQGRAPSSLWLRADDFMRAVIGAFFVAIFATGGVYLTPELHTPNEWVSWLQLLIAASVFSRRTMPLGAAGIIGLWAMALRDYDAFHLLDYLALGVGVAGYLATAAFPESKLYDRRFTILRWGVAIAVMWSSFEKLAYPEWFHPLIAERPYLALGMSHEAFIPMAGVAEFALGFGLLWDPLVRRLSAIALLIVFTLAVYPFGRVDLIGHSFIMGTLALVAVEPVHRVSAASNAWRAVAKAPLALAGAAVVIGGAYWGLHGLLYAKPRTPASLQAKLLICGQTDEGAALSESSARTKWQPKPVAVGSME